jgi:hypothetical protein
LTSIKYGSGTDSEKKQQYIAYHRDVYPIWIRYFERLHTQYLEQAQCQQPPCELYIAGTARITFADFLMMDVVDTHRLLLAPALDDPTYNPLKGTRRLDQWYARVAARPHIARYLASEKRRHA